MAYVPVRSGFTGPSAKIGGSTDYHIDLKLLQSLPIADRVKAIDSLANQYRSIGREIEFSNAAVSGQRWDPSKDLSDKVDLLQRAAAAHSHSSHPGWQSLDFYVPFKGKNRFDKGAVEDASIFLPAVPGGRVRRASGGGYGYYSEAMDPSGRVVFRVGHGNVDRPEDQAELTVAAQAATPTAATNASTPDGNTLTNAFLATMLQNQQGQTEFLESLANAIGARDKPKSLSQQVSQALIGNALNQALAPQNFLNRFMGEDPYLQGSALGTSQFLSGNLF